MHRGTALGGLSARDRGGVDTWPSLLATHPPPATPPPRTLECCSAQVAHRSDIMATGGTDNTVRVWDVRMGKLLQEGVGHSAKVTALQFSPDDKQLVSVGDDGCVFVWNVYT